MLYSRPCVDTLVDLSSQSSLTCSKPFVPWTRNMVAELGCRQLLSAQVAGVDAGSDC